MQNYILIEHSHTFLWFKNGSGDLCDHEIGCLVWFYRPRHVSFRGFQTGTHISNLRKSPGSKFCENLDLNGSIMPFLPPTLWDILGGLQWETLYSSFIQKLLQIQILWRLFRMAWIKRVCHVLRKQMDRGKSKKTETFTFKVYFERCLILTQFLFWLIWIRISWHGSEFSFIHGVLHRTALFFGSQKWNLAEQLYSRIVPRPLL